MNNSLTFLNHPKASMKIKVLARAWKDRDRYYKRGKDMEKVNIELNEDDYDSELSFSKRWDKAEEEMLSGDILTQDEFFQRIRNRIKQCHLNKFSESYK